MDLQNLTCMLIFNRNITDREYFGVWEGYSRLKMRQNLQNQQFSSIKSTASPINHCGSCS